MRTRIRPSAAGGSHQGHARQKEAGAAEFAVALAWRLKVSSEVAGVCVVGCVCFNEFRFRLQVPAA